MIWLYRNNVLEVCSNATNKITPEVFEHLVGKALKWKPRESKKLITERLGRYIRVYDEKFIVGEKYKKNSTAYTCEYINTKGNALLVPVKPKLRAVCALSTNGWEVV